MIVAISEPELPLLDRIYQRGQQNGVQCEVIGPERLKELEPHTPGIRAIHVPEAGIVNYREVARKLAELIAARGGEVRCGARVLSVHEDGRFDHAGNYDRRRYRPTIS